VSVPASQAVTFKLLGAGGGGGGAQFNIGGHGGQGALVSGTLTNTSDQPQTLIVYIGQGGSGGEFSGNSGHGGSGGSSGLNYGGGGNGGNGGPYQSAGGGGGGGASAILLSDNSTVLVVAGAGAGGGGEANDSNGAVPQDVGAMTPATVPTIPGSGTAENPLADGGNASYFENYPGGGGGGGGGAPTGNGGGAGDGDNIPGSGGDGGYSWWADSAAGSAISIDPTNDPAASISDGATGQGVGGTSTAKGRDGNPGTDGSASFSGYNIVQADSA
jgi:hypothetical protein